jgi:hypothetical protein
MRIKIWSSLAVATGGLSAMAHAQTVESAQPSDYPGGTIEKQVEKMLANEGGEEGLGLTKLRPSFSVPALRSSEIQKVVVGNTVGISNNYAYHFEPQGKVRGWLRTWEKKAAAACPMKEGPNYLLEDGECWHWKDAPIASQWTVRNDKLCIPNVEYERPTRSEYCYAMAVVFNNVVLFNDEGGVVGKAVNLTRGDTTAAPRS